MRVSSTHIVSVPVSAGVVALGVSAVVGVVVAPSLELSLEQALIVSARPRAAATTGMLRRIFDLLVSVGVPASGFPPSLA